jgi:exonuclease SbcC
VRAADAALGKSKIDQQIAQQSHDQTKSEIDQQKALKKQVEDRLPALQTALTELNQSCLNDQAVYRQHVAPFGLNLNQLDQVPAQIAEFKTRVDTYNLKAAEAAKCATQLRVDKAKGESLTQQVNKAVAAAAEAQEKLNRAQDIVSQQATLRNDKFGSGVVADDQRAADETLKHLRESWEKAQASLAVKRQEHTNELHLKILTQDSLKNRVEQHANFIHRLQLDAVGAGFASGAELRESILSLNLARTFLELREKLNQRHVELAALATALTNRRNALPPSAKIDAPNLAALEASRAASETERNQREGNLGGLKSLLQTDDTHRAQQAAYRAKIEAAEREYIRWYKLSNLIGSADGTRFARFAQGLTLEHLTLLANRHLKQLNPRYSIRRATGNEADDLELKIIDHYQADAPRPMQSLSGGESFLASLALALGLSELASGKTRIDSLFIDEGFGTLDSDTLEIAMSALENLQATGKTIGVISHVPAMQERILTQIKVIKHTGGCSRIELVS